MRVIIPEGSSSRLGPRHCEAPGCPHTTREGKPFCTDHVEMNPHAKKVVVGLTQQEKDDERAARSRRKVNTNGITATSVLQNVSYYGPRTKERLCRELNVDMDVLDGYVQALLKEGKISLGQTRRGSEVVSLAG